MVVEPQGAEVPRIDQKDVDTGIILVLWCTWKHRNAVVFDGRRPHAWEILCLINQEGAAWYTAGLLKNERFRLDNSVGVWNISE